MIIIAELFFVIIAVGYILDSCVGLTVTLIVPWSPKMFHCQFHVVFGELLILSFVNCFTIVFQEQLLNTITVLIIWILEFVWAMCRLQYGEYYECKKDEYRYEGSYDEQPLSSLTWSYSKILPDYIRWLRSLSKLCFFSK